VLVRLGNLLYWLGNALAILFALGGAVVLFRGEGPDPISFGITGLVIAVLVWLVGRAARYLFAGK